MPAPSSNATCARLTAPPSVAGWRAVAAAISLASYATLARALLIRHPLRSGDAIQLASALRLQQITQLPLTAFVAYDARLIAAATSEGLSVS